MSEAFKEPKSPRDKHKGQRSAKVAVVNSGGDEPPVYAGERPGGIMDDESSAKIQRRSIVHQQGEAEGNGPAEGDTNAANGKEFEFLSPRRKGKGGMGIEAISVLVVMSFKVIVAPIILLAICVQSDFLRAPYVFQAAADSAVGYMAEDPDVAYTCPDCSVPCERAVLQLSQFGSDPMMGKPAYGSLRTNTFDGYNSTLTTDAIALVAALDAAGAVCGDGTSSSDHSLSFISAEPKLIAQAIDILGLPVSNDMAAEVASAATSSCSSRWTVQSRLKTFMFQPIPHINEFSSILAADLTVFPEDLSCRSDVPYDTDLELKRAFVSEGLDQTRNAPTTLRLFPYNFPCQINVQPRAVAPTDASLTAKVVQPMLHGYYGGCFVHLVNTSGIYIENDCEISSLWIDYGLMLQAPDDIPLCSTEGICVHNYYNSQWEWVSIPVESTDSINLHHNAIRSRYADKVEMSVLPGIVVLQILVMSMMSMYQVMGQKQSVLLSQIWAYRCQNGRMQAVYLMQIAYHLYRESDTYYLALGTGTMSVEALWNLTFCVMGFSYSFVNIVKSRTGEQQLDRHFRLTWELVLLLVTAGVAILLDKVRSVSLTPILDINSKTLLRSSEEGANVCKITDSCIVFKLNIAVIIAAFSMVVWGFTASIAYVLRTYREPQPLQDLKDWLKSWRQAFVLTIRPPPKKRAASRSGSIINLTDATSFESYCIGEHFRFMFNDCEDISHVKKGNLRVPSAEAVLLSGFVYRGKHIYRAGDVVPLLATRFLPKFVLRTFNVLIVRWDVNPNTYEVSRPTVCLWTEVGREWRKKTKPFPSA